MVFCVSTRGYPRMHANCTHLTWESISNQHSIFVQHSHCKVVRYVLGMHAYTVHDTENLTFSEEFHGCSARNDADFPHGCRGTSARVCTDLPCVQAQIFHAGGHESSVRIRLKMAETRRRTSCATTLKDRETRRKDRSKYHYRTC